MRKPRTLPEPVRGQDTFRRRQGIGAEEKLIAPVVKTISSTSPAPCRKPATDADAGQAVAAFDDEIEQAIAPLLKPRLRDEWGRNLFPFPPDPSPPVPDEIAEALRKVAGTLAGVVAMIEEIADKLDARESSRTTTRRGR